MVKIKVVRKNKTLTWSHQLDWMKPSSFVPDFAVDIKVWVCSKFRLSNPKTFVFAFSLFFFARDCRLKLVFFLPVYMYKERHS